MKETDLYLPMKEWFVNLGYQVRPEICMTGRIYDAVAIKDNTVIAIEMKLSLARSLREHRHALNLTQDEVAKNLGSSQSRVAKMEAADATVSMELLVRSLLVLGAGRDEVGRVIGRSTAGPMA